MTDPKLKAASKVSGKKEIHTLQHLDFSSAICCHTAASRRLLLLGAAAAAAADAPAADVAGCATVSPVARQETLVLRTLRPAVNFSRPHDWEGVAEGACLCVAQVPAQYAVLCGFVIRASLQQHNSAVHDSGWGQYSILRTSHLAFGAWSPWQFGTCMNKGFVLQV